ncbi:MAG: S-adenosylmethionine:tRNA ribosyltransferase-isomerase [Salinivirgaceae bacterium]|jgi:S-adenosylmethionine:tRNA ribosyltransferase-isomerase|nr:S-adenosylmethionine:tRNA ribosyltransferase-isomerase [Salinivirgaceae bacterium]
MSLKQIKIDEYNYNLPDEKIAKYPLKRRDESKLLISDNETIKEDTFKNLGAYLPNNSLLVANNTKVIRARLEFFKDTGARIEVFCLEPFLPSDYVLSFESNTSCQWTCIVGNLKKWKTGILEKSITVNGSKTTLKIERLKSGNEWHIIEFKWDNCKLTFSEIIENSGNIPIPPYLNRRAEKVDLDTYQTVYSKHKGSVAAPTAGLHFTNDVFNSLKQKNIVLHEVTLHVGAGTFKPVKAENIGEHEMHTEHFIITPKTIQPLLENIGNITAVGTTTVRTLESLYWLGVKLLSMEKNATKELHIDQWEAYELSSDFTVAEAFKRVHKEVNDSLEDHLNASTAIMIAPGYTFRVVDRIITNFHQPKSTLLLLVSAFIGKKWKEVYNYALENEFRFLSYGDSCFFNKKGEQ